MHIWCNFSCYRCSLCDCRVKSIHFSPQITVALKTVKTYVQMGILHSHISLPHNRSLFQPYLGPIKKPCTAKAMVQNKVNHQKVKCLCLVCIHIISIHGNRFKNIAHLSLLVLIVSFFSILCFAVPWLLVAKIHRFLIIDTTALFLDIVHLLIF